MARESRGNAGSSAGRPPRPRQRALSCDQGAAWAPKDFHHHAVSVPCQAACPAGTDVPEYLEAIWNDDFAAAYRINLRDNVFPAVLGRVCTRPCEPACRHGRAGNGQPVAICFAKRSADDFMRREQPVVLPSLFPSSGKRVAVIGAGPAGLAAARELARWGHTVLVLEKESKPGGLLVSGIPAFRLPRETVEREIEQVRLQGVDIRCGQGVDSPEALDRLLAEHDAVVAATGCTALSRPPLPGDEAAGVEHGLEFLRRANLGGHESIAGPVTVIGGGFTAVDCARMARRLGASPVVLAYRRGREQMIQAEHELAQFAVEDIGTEFQASPAACLAEGGRVRAVRLSRNRLGPAGADGKPAIEPVPGTDFDLPAARVLLATGQRPDRSLFQSHAGNPRLFFAGDVEQGSSSVIEAIAHAKRVARAVDRALTGSDRFREVVRVSNPGRTQTGRPRERNRVARFPMPELDAAGRFRSPDAEVETGLSRGAAREESGRCYFCQYTFEIDNDLCIYCDRCLKVTPVPGCIVKVSDWIFDAEDRLTGLVRSTGPRDYKALVIDQDQCIRCGACVEVCPVECITLRKTTRETMPR